MSPYAEDARPPRAPGGRGNLLSLLALLTAVSLLGYVLWVRGDLPFGIADPTPRPVQPRGDLSAHEETIIEIFERASPSVVFVSTRSADRRNLRGDTRQGDVTGSGTGFLWDAQGHIVTNFHVIEPALSAGTPPLVTLSDQQTYEAEVVGYAPTKDLALLRIDAPTRRFTPILLGTSNDLRVGQTVLAIGNPFGLDQTLTVGIVSALDRSMRSPSEHLIEGVIQTDAAINPGNSGGPLLDSAGRLIGVNTMIYSKSGSSAGIGFAVPVDEVAAAVPDLIRFGHVSRPGLGVRLSMPRSFYVGRQPVSVQGVEIYSADPDSAAGQAGLRGYVGLVTDPRDPRQMIPQAIRKVGDFIQAIDGVPVSQRLDLLDVLGRYEIGDEVTLTVWREGTTLEIPVTLQAVDG
ncbi:MAG: 2-alkenal reductase [Planctomycetota bacterium]|nr:MAG: 2-alkenal reductase [Planctomycetota bacterium]